MFIPATGRQSRETLGTRLNPLMTTGFKLGYVGGSSNHCAIHAPQTLTASHPHPKKNGLNHYVKPTQKAIYIFITEFLVVLVRNNNHVSMIKSVQTIVTYSVAAFLRESFQSLI